MKFQVPQFIEVESKIFGPFTFKQFIYLAGGGGMVFIAYSFLPIFIALPIIALIGTLSLALAFYKVNKRPFINVLESFFKYQIGNKLYIWKKEDRVVKPQKEAEKAPEIFIPRLSDSKLKDISWSLDVQQSIYSEEDNANS